MHQIRVHLQWLGYPIVNDPIYNHPAWKQHPLSSNSGDQSNIERVISEIVRTNYSSQVTEKKQEKVPSKCDSTQDILPGEATETESFRDSHDGPTTGDKLSSVPRQSSPCSAFGTSLSCPGDIKGSLDETVEEHSDNSLSTEQTIMASSSAKPVVDDVCTNDGVDPDCSECGLERSDPSPADLLMYLHALSYKVGI